ncbi:acyl carrier protein [Streptomyces sp. WMMB303]|uniref:acyl carrier protein n=1 Tax=Streptomyces sp. WMMB303 TaxID=3034154 RepID=UPI0023EAE13C|nr:acyl carrier protein [Streptomyces sp. WMMB303]MDF4251986.1 acyl carrier protein [Streptomyces sp. WMMB303]
MDSVHDQVITALTDKFDIPAEGIAPGVTLTELGLDSLAVTELLVTLQEQYAVGPPDDAVTGEATPDDVAALVRKLQSGESRPAGQGTQE